MNFKLASVAAAVAATLALAACGGGGSGNGGFFPQPTPVPAPAPPPAPAPAPAPAPVPATTTYLYEALAPSVDLATFEATLQSQGARGFRFWSPLSSFDGTTTESALVFVKSIDVTYTYELKPATASAAALIAEANEAGGRGFRWVGPISINGTSYGIYRKESGTNAAYTYRSAPMPASKADYLSQGNAQGAEGYYNSAPFFQAGGDSLAVFEKNTASNATYAYELGEPVNSEAEGMAQFNEKGSRGFRFRGPASFPADGLAQMFVKDLSQSVTFAYETQAPQGTMAATIAQANELGARNFGVLGPLGTGNGTESRNFYFKPLDCTGPVMCAPTGPFGP